MIDTDKVQAAREKDYATHRFPTSVKWGNGYFGDGFRYVVANSIHDVVEQMKPCGIDYMHVQVPENANKSGWRFSNRDEWAR